MRTVRLKAQIAELEGRIAELEGLTDEGLRQQNAELTEALAKLQADFSVAQQELVAFKAVSAEEEAAPHEEEVTDDDDNKETVDA